MKNTEKMKQLILNYLGMQKKLEFSILDLEKFIIEKYESLNSYSDDGGYVTFSYLITELEKSSQIKPIKSALKETNNRTPALPKRWKKVKKKTRGGWTEQQLFQVADRLDISYYLKNPEHQNEKAWKAVLSIYHFLGEKEKWQWESKASRSYQLFQDEKFLNTEGRNILGRLKLSNEDLKIWNYGEPFSYYVHPKILNYTEVNSILIIENLSFFHACRRVIKLNRQVLGIKIDMIIYAEGTHIESSIKYLQDILEHRDYHIHYVGDMDPSGYSIFARVKKKNPQFNISLAKNIYYRMVDVCIAPTPLTKEQVKNTEHFKFFMDEMGEQNQRFALVAEEIWNQGKRIPQEVLPIDILLKGDGNNA